MLISKLKIRLRFPLQMVKQVVNASLQLSFDADYQALWGQTYGGIYDVDESLYAVLITLLIRQPGRLNTPAINLPMRS